MFQFLGRGVAYFCGDEGSSHDTFCQEGKKVHDTFQAEPVWKKDTVKTPKNNDTFLEGIKKKPLGLGSLILIIIIIVLIILFRARVFEFQSSCVAHLCGGEGGGKCRGHDTFKQGAKGGHDTFGKEKEWARDTFGNKSNDTFVK